VAADPRRDRRQQRTGSNAIEGSWVWLRTTLMSVPQQLAIPILLFFAWGVLTYLEAMRDLLEKQAD
jgi:hypothetical protein